MYHTLSVESATIIREPGTDQAMVSQPVTPLDTPMISEIAILDRHTKAEIVQRLCEVLRANYLALALALKSVIARLADRVADRVADSPPGAYRALLEEAQSALKSLEATG
jgi:hypothetical protein